MTKFNFSAKINFHTIVIITEYKRKMPNIWDKNCIYRTAISPMHRADIFATFREYISLTTNLETILNKNKIDGLADLSASRYYDEGHSSWQMMKASPDEQTRYKNFVNQGLTEDMPKEAYISMNLTSPKHQNDGAGILAVPSSYDYFCGGHTLPHRIERYVVAAEKNETLEDLKLIVDGKYVIKYSGKNNQTELMEALKDNDFEMELLIALDIISMFPDKSDDKEIIKKANIEALASATTAPVENIILDALSLMAEESNKIIKSIMGKRSGSSYLAQAEKENLLPSASMVQDYLNIRHLLHHQWDTLDSMGKFNETEVIKNASVRQRFLDSYARLCDKPIDERIKAYTKATEYFLPLVLVLNENIIKKDEQESDAEFLNRFKDFVASHKGKPLFVITGYDDKQKKQSLIISISSAYPDAQIVDKINDESDIENLNELVDSYRERRQFIDIFQDMEYRISQYCLYYGKNYTPAIAWDFIRRGGVINQEQTKHWSEYKKLRNDLSHRYMDKSLNTTINEIMPQFIEYAVQLKTELERRMPIIHRIQDNVYRATHANGLVVDIDFTNKKVLSVTNSKGETTQPIYKTDPQTQKKHIYTEEYTNGISITMAGTDIVGCRMNNGITVNKEKRFIRYSDGVTLYLDSPENIYLTSLEGEKFIMNKGFKVEKYINRNKEIDFHKKEQRTLRNKHKIFIGVYGEINKDIWFNKEEKQIQSYYHRAEDRLYFEYSDGTKIEFTATDVRISHNDIPLTYQNRKKFAESYTDTSPKIPTNTKDMEY